MKHESGICTKQTKGNLHPLLKSSITVKDILEFSNPHISVELGNSTLNTLIETCEHVRYQQTALVTEEHSLHFPRDCYRVHYCLDTECVTTGALPKVCTGASCRNTPDWVLWNPPKCFWPRNFSNNGRFYRICEKRNS